MATISAEILSRYAADAARELAGVRRVVGRRGSRVSEADGHVTVELHLALDRGLPIPALARAVQASVRDYLGRMADLESVVVNVVVDELA